MVPSHELDRGAVHAHWDDLHGRRSPDGQNRHHQLWLHQPEARAQAAHVEPPPNEA